MRKAYLIYISILLAGIFSCKKNDFIPAGMFQKIKCDYSQAYAPGLIPETTGPIYLFSKTYDVSNRLSQITFRLRNVAYFPVNQYSYTVSYPQGHMVFTGMKGETVYDFEFNKQGRLDNVNGNGYRFIYRGSKLTAIVNGVESAPFIQLSYDKTNKNISKLLFFHSGSYDSIQYVYDYSRKIKEQVYPDDMIGDGASFYFFLKYLNVLPDLQPENMLTRSTYGSTEFYPYPSFYDRVYTNHTTDKEGKLVSYTQTSHRSYDITLVENWSIDWKCFK
jgi:hypothetical protein